MAKLNDIQDIVDLEVKSLEQVNRETKRPDFYKRYFEIEKKLQEQGLAPSLSAYLLYEHQFNRKSVSMLGSMLGVSKTSINNLFKKMSIPIYSSLETTERLNEDPEHRKEFGKRMKEYYQNPEHRRVLSDRMKKLNANSEYKEANRNRARIRIIEFNKNPKFRKAQSEAMKKLHQNPKYMEKISALFKRIRYDPKHRETNAEATRKLHKDPSYKSKLIDAIKKHHREDLKYQKENTIRCRNMGIQTCESLRKKAYFVESRFYSSSMQEGAVALLLEKYVPGYNVKEGETFQVRNKGMDNGGIDFLIENEFLEWHPIVISDCRRGDITSSFKKERKREYDAWFSLKGNLKLEEKKIIDKILSEEIAEHYFKIRKQSIDNSGYVGNDLTLATNVEELHKFIQKYGKNVPDLVSFKSEFSKSVKEMKKYKVQER